MIACDLSIPESVFKATDILLSLNRPIDGLICCAGLTEVGHKGLEDPDPDNWINVFKVNVLANQILTARLAPLLEQGDNPVIAYVSSIVGSAVAGRNSGTVSYTLSKATLNRLGVYMAAQLAAHNIHVLNIEPGWVQTDMTGQRGEKTPDAAAADILSIVLDARRFKSGSFINTNAELLSF